MKPQRINSQEELDKFIKENNNEPLDCFVLLNYGLKSSKEISMIENGDYWIYNDVDDTEDIYSHDELMDSFIGEAITKGALYKY